MQSAAIDLLFQPAAGTCSSPEAALAAMDEAGIAVAFVAPCAKLTCERQWACVDTRLEDVARFLRVSIRFAGLGGYNPFDSAESLREMEAAHALGFRGTCVHLDAFGLPLDDSRFYPLYAKSAELQQPVIVQMGAAESDPARAVRRIGRDFPELRLALAHPQPTPEMFGLCGDFEQLAFVLDSDALALVARSNAASLESPALAGRCMWGSSGAELKAAVAAARDLSLASATLAAILRDNALRFFSATNGSRQPRVLSGPVLSAER